MDGASPVATQQPMRMKLLPLSILALAVFLPFASRAGAESTLAATLTKTGTCPGPMSLTVSGATPGGLVVILRGVPGSFVWTGTPCTGITINVINVNGTLPTVVSQGLANAGGIYAVSFNAPAAACGATLQAVDVLSCKTTNTITL